MGISGSKSGGSLGNTTVTNNAYLNFYGASSAGNATINNARLNVADNLNFSDTASAGSAVINNYGYMNFYGSSTGENATITNESFITFHNSATASSSASAVGATIINNSTMDFFDNSSAGKATITNNYILDFDDNSSASAATVINNGMLVLGENFHLRSSILSIGELRSSGSIFIGSQGLMVGALNTDSAVSGSIQDEDNFGSGTGGSLTKTGTGTLTLSGANTYTGGTFVNAGTIAYSADSNLGAASGSVTLASGLLKYVGTSGSHTFSTSRVLTVSGTGGGFDITNINGVGTQIVVASAIGGTGSLTKTGTGALMLSGANTYTGGTIINAGALTTSSRLGSGTGPVIINGTGPL